MFGSIGPGELLLIAGVALVLIGPERFPEFAKIVLRTIRDLRGYVEDVKGDISKELRPLKDEVRSLGKYRPEEILETVVRGEQGEPEGKSKPVDPEDVYDETLAGTYYGPYGESVPDAPPSPQDAEDLESNDRPPQE